MVVGAILPGSGPLLLIPKVGSIMQILVGSILIPIQAPVFGCGPPIMVGNGPARAFIPIFSKILLQIGFILLKSETENPTFTTTRPSRLSKKTTPFFFP